MAKDLELKTNVNGPSGDYPSGQIRNDDGSGNGTPVTEGVYGDFHQFFAKILRDTDVDPNNQNENTTNGFQYNEALRKMPQKSYFSTSDLSAGSTGDYTAIYDFAITQGFGNQLIDFDIVSYATTQARRRKANIKINVHHQATMATSFNGTSGIKIQKDNEQAWYNDDIVVTLLIDNSTQKYFRVYARYRYQYETMLVNTNIQRKSGGGTFNEFSLSNILSPGAITGVAQYRVNPLWIGETSLVNSITSTKAGLTFQNANYLQGWVKNGIMNIAGQLNSNAAAYAVGEIFVIDIFLSDNYRVNREGVISNNKIMLGSGNFYGNTMRGNLYVETSQITSDVSNQLRVICNVTASSANTNGDFKIFAQYPIY